MKNRLHATLLLCTAFLATTSGVQALSAAREWNEQLLSAIRQTIPNPPQHARNLFYLSAAMYNAWAAYDTTAIGYLQNEKISPLPTSSRRGMRPSAMRRLACCGTGSPRLRCGMPLMRS